MKKNRKLLGGFVALLHICLIAFPLLVLGYNVAYRTIQSNQSYVSSCVSSLEDTKLVPVYYESNEVSSVDDLTPGNIYHYSISNNASSNLFVLCDLIIPSEGFELHTYTIEREVPYFKVYQSNYLTILYVSQAEIYSNTYNYGSFFFVYKSASNNLSSIISNISKANIQIVKEYVEVTEDDINISTEVTYSFEDNSYLGLRDTLSYFNVMPSDFSLDNFSWSDTFDNSNGFPLLMNVDYLSIFDLGDSYNDSLNSVLAFINFYFNWIINMSIVVFVPEMLIVFIDICRKLIYSFSHKIEGGY